MRMQKYRCDDHSRRGDRQAMKVRRAHKWWLPHFQFKTVKAEWEKRKQRGWEIILLTPPPPSFPRKYAPAVCKPSQGHRRTIFTLLRNTTTVIIGFMTFGVRHERDSDKAGGGGGGRKFWPLSFKRENSKWGCQSRFCVSNAGTRDFRNDVPLHFATIVLRSGSCGTALCEGVTPAASIFSVPLMRHFTVLRVWNETTTSLRLRLFYKSHLNLKNNN